jgi:hypothetical protein
MIADAVRPLMRQQAAKFTNSQNSSRLALLHNMHRIPVLPDIRSMQAC